MSNATYDPSLESPCKGVNLQKYWRDHTVVTDDMVAWLKKSLQLATWEGIMDVNANRFERLFNETIPNGRVCWERQALPGQCAGSFNVVQPQHVLHGIILTDKDGQNPETGIHWLTKKWNAEGKQDEQTGDVVQVEESDFGPFFWRMSGRGLVKVLTE